MSQTALPPSLRPTLPGRLYTDPSTFEREQARIFESMWFAVARAGELARPGQYATRQVGTESVVVVRGRDGALRAFLNVCRHRGARLCEPGQGEVRRAFSCSYHAWTYDLEGTLIAAPNLSSI